MRACAGSIRLITNYATGCVECEQKAWRYVRPQAFASHRATLLTLAVILRLNCVRSDPQWCHPRAAGTLRLGLLPIQYPECLVVEDVFAVPRLIGPGDVRVESTDVVRHTRQQFEDWNVPRSQIVLSPVRLNVFRPAGGPTSTQGSPRPMGPTKTWLAPHPQTCRSGHRCSCEEGIYGPTRVRLKARSGPLRRL